jgi:hypothetical protein
MYDEIKRRIEQRMSERPSFSIERIATKDIRRKRDASRISALVTAELKRHMSEMYDDIDAAEAAAHPRDKVREFGGLRTRRQLEKHFIEQLSTYIGSRQEFEFTVPSGSRGFKPPYDLDWIEGNGMSKNLSHLNGEVSTIPTRNGFSAAGIGFYLATNEPALAAITPEGKYNWFWQSFENLPFARSRGGLGIAVYTDSEPQPTTSRQPLLWSVSGMIGSNPRVPWSGQKGEGNIADAASPAFGLGTVPLAPVLVNMVPESRYLVWVWCWQTSRLERDDAFNAYLHFVMPGVIINAGPPILIR